MAALNRPIALVGFMGAGKSLVGRKLAKATKRAYADLDEEVARQAGVGIAELFSREGEGAFRKREIAELRELLQSRRDLVISCGGGVVTTERGRKALRGALVVYLAVSEERLARRLERSSGRPLLEGYEGEARVARIHELLALRRPMYAKVADIAVDAGRPPDEVVRRIIRELEAHEHDDDSRQADEV